MRLSAIEIIFAGAGRVAPGEPFEVDDKIGAELVASGSAVERTEKIEAPIGASAPPAASDDGAGDQAQGSVETGTAESAGTSGEGAGSTEGGAEPPSTSPFAALAPLAPERLAAIEAVLSQLDAESFTAAGAPKVAVLRALVGFLPTAEETARFKRSES